MLHRERERQEREAMTRHSVGGERLDGRLAGEVWMQLATKRCPMHWRRSRPNMLADVEVMTPSSEVT